MITIGSLLIGLLQALALLLVAPFFSGLSRVLRAKMHSRRGPGLLQNYRDLAKLMKRQEVIPAQTGWIFRAAPYVMLAAMLAAAALLPLFTTASPLGWAGDLILVVYLYALGRIFFALAGLETGSTFGGIGARRELLVSALIEPVLLLVLFVLALSAGSTNLGAISTGIASGNLPFRTSVWLGMLAFAFAAFIEMGRLPFDLAEAEQELQEGPLSEYSGRSLALVKWGLYLKQLTLTSLFITLFLPFGSLIPGATGPLTTSVPVAIAIFFAKLLACYFLMALFENAMARVRFLKASVVTWAALGAAVLSFVFYLANV